jgi:hypothetical protein
MRLGDQLKTLPYEREAMVTSSANTLIFTLRCAAERLARSAVQCQSPLRLGLALANPNHLADGPLGRAARIA